MVGIWLCISYVKIKTKHTQHIYDQLLCDLLNPHVYIQRVSIYREEQISPIMRNKFVSVTCKSYLFIHTRVKWTQETKRYFHRNIQNFLDLLKFHTFKKESFVGKYYQVPSRLSRPSIKCESYVSRLTTKRVSIIHQKIQKKL